MRAGDLLLLAGLFVLGAGIAVPYIRAALWRRRWLLCAGLTVVVASQILLRRFYWQLIPADIAYLSLAVACATIADAQRIRLRLIALSAFALGLASLSLLIVLPIFQLPRPTGPYPVGTRIMHFVDDSRSDATFASGHRELMVQVWYPADAARGPLAPYRRWKETTLLSSYDAFLKTHSHLDAAVAHRGSPFPVLLFNPGWGGQRTQSTYQTEYLASFGYIVIAIDHTHNAAIVAFPGGKIVKAAKVSSIDDFSHATLEQQMSKANRELDTQVKDDIFVLNAFAAMNSYPHSPWYHAMDMGRIGAMGHSFGGAVAVETCFRDPRVQAALNMDGWMFGAISRRVLRKPLFAMYERGWPPDVKILAKESASGLPSDRVDIWDLHNLDRTLANEGGYVLTIKKSRHMNFADRSLYSPIRFLTDSGPIDPVLVHRVINEYTLAFFNHVLKGEPEPLLNKTQDPFKVAKFTKWGAPVKKAQESADAGN